MTNRASDVTCYCQEVLFAHSTCSIRLLAHQDRRLHPKESPEQTPLLRLSHTTVSEADEVEKLKSNVCYIQSVSIGLTY